MAHDAGVLAGVPVRRRIAAAHMTAGEAKPKVNPPVPRLQTLFAASGVRLHILDLIQMRTFTHQSHFCTIVSVCKAFKTVVPVQRPQEAGIAAGRVRERRFSSCCALMPSRRIL